MDFSGTRSKSSNFSSPSCVLGLTPNIAKRALRHRARSFVRSRQLLFLRSILPPVLSLFSFFLAPSRLLGCQAPFTLRSFVFLLNFGGAFSPRIGSPLSWRVSKTPRNFLIKRNIVWKGLIYSTREATFMVSAATTSYEFLWISPNKYPQISSPLGTCACVCVCVYRFWNHFEKLLETELRDCQDCPHTLRNRAWRIVVRKRAPTFINVRALNIETCDPVKGICVIISLDSF